MNASVRLAAIFFSLVLVVAIACDDRASEVEGPPAPQALSDSIEAGYERLQRMYASADTLSPDVQRMRGAMGKMHEQMQHRRQGRGGGMHGGGGMHDGSERQDGQRRHGRQPGHMHGDQRADSRRDSTRMWEWHQQMMSMHAQMARIHRDSGMARRHRQMQRQHRQMMNALPSADESAPSESQKRAPSGDAVQGDDLYVQHCASCHGQQGAGLGPFPPLAGSEWVTGEEDTAIRILLHGLRGRIEVGGRIYNNVMPAFGRRLSDDEVAVLLSFVRSAWGNEAEAVVLAEVREVRAKHSGRSQPWTASELREDD